jgi:hypothetical protein
MSCENLKFLYTECIKKIHSQEYNPKVVDECFKLWDNLIKCVNTDIIITLKNDRDSIKRTSGNYDLLFENK